jgi:opacity protein-like surface antigen
MRIRSVTSALGAALTLFAAAAVPALAADYPVLRGSQIEDAPPPPSDLWESANWNGFYFGGLAGQTQTRFESDRGLGELANFAMLNTTIAGQLNVDQLVATLPRRDSGASFGAFLGYNVQFGDVVLGIEADYSRIDQSATASRFEARRVGNEFFAIASQQDAELRDNFSLRARFGYAFGRVMPYFTLGAAAGRFNTNVAIATDWGPTDANGVALGSYFGWPRRVGGPKKDVWGYGGVIGGGIEAALTDNIILRAEYLFTRFDNVEGITASLNTARVGAALKF